MRKTTRESSARIISILSDIRTQNLPNTGQQRFRLTKLGLWKSVKLISIPSIRLNGQCIRIFLIRAYFKPKRFASMSALFYISTSAFGSDVSRAQCVSTTSLCWFKMLFLCDSGYPSRKLPRLTATSQVLWRVWCRQVEMTLERRNNDVDTKIDSGCFNSRIHKQVLPAPCSVSIASSYISKDAFLSGLWTTLKLITTAIIHVKNTVASKQE